MSKVSPEGVSIVAEISKVLSDLLLHCTNFSFCWSLHNINCASSSLIFLSCQISFGVTCSRWDLCMKDLMCLMAYSSSLESTTFLSYQNVHESTVFIHFCLVYLFPFAGRITVAKGLDNLTDFSFWLDCLSTLVGRIALGDSAVFTILGHLCYTCGISPSLKVYTLE